MGEQLEFKPVELTEEETIAYKWQYRMFGSFYQGLMDLISIADQSNLNKLSLAFPVHVSAYRKFSTEEGWFEKVVERAQIPSE